MYALRERDKWTKHASKINVNDDVLVKDNNTKSSLEISFSYCTEVHRGRDGHIRTVSIRTASGNYVKRPVRLLFPIECNSRIDSSEVGNSAKDKSLPKPSARQAAIDARNKWQRK